MGSGPPILASDGQTGQSRFAGWSRGNAALLMVALGALLLSTLLPQPAPAVAAQEERAATAPARAARRDADLQFYDSVIARVRAGENYYAFIVDAQRAAHYPVRPGLTVRLPTLAYLAAAAGAPGAMLAAVLLMLATLWAWWRRLGAELGPARGVQRRFATALLFVGGALCLNPYYHVLHELWAGMLIALAIGLHRPRARGDGGRWVGTWIAAALALAIREQALPFVLLLAAYAGWRRAWRELAAWLVLIGLFAAGLALHLQLVTAHTSAADPGGPSWLAFRGLGGWLSNVTLSGNLRFLPAWLGGAAVLLMLLGYAGLRTPLGAFVLLLQLGYGLAFMIAGRADNFYWGAVIAPSLFPGLAFAPGALASLLRAARGVQASVTKISATNCQLPPTSRHFAE